MKIKFKDLELAYQYIKQNSHAEILEVEDNTTSCDIAFTDNNNKATRIMLFESSRAITPEIRTTTKLYKPTVKT